MIGLKMPHCDTRKSPPLPPGGSCSKGADCGVFSHHLEGTVSHTSPCEIVHGGNLGAGLGAGGCLWG